MMNHKRILVFTIIVACISLAVSLPRIVNADESLYQVMEFVGSSDVSFEDAIQNALKAEPSFNGIELMNEDPFEAESSDEIVEQHYMRIDYLKTENHGEKSGSGEFEFAVRIRFINQP